MSRSDPVPIPVVAELNPDVTWSPENLEIALTELVQSLEIPARPMLQVVDGTGRLRVGAQAIRLDSLRIAIGHAIPRSHGMWRLASAFVTPEVVQRVWRDWMQEDEKTPVPTVPVDDAQWMLARGAALGYKTSRFRQAAMTLVDSPQTAARTERFEEAISTTDCCVVRLTLSSSDATGYVASSNATWQQALAARARDVAEHLFQMQGLLLPSIDVRVEQRLPAAAFRLEWNDLRLPPCVMLSENEAFIEGPVETLNAVGIRGMVVRDTLLGRTGFVVDSTTADGQAAQPFTKWRGREFLFPVIESMLAHSDGALVNRTLLELYLLRLRDTSPTLAQEVQAAFAIGRTTEIARALIVDGVSLRHLIPTLTSLMEYAEPPVAIDQSKYIVFSPLGVATTPPHRDSPDMPRETVHLNFVRAALKQIITHKFAPDGLVKVFLVDPEIERRLAGQRAITAADREAVLSALDDEVRSAVRAPEVPIILTTLEVRQPLAEMIHTEYPDVQVLSYQELSPYVNIRPLARIYAEFTPQQEEDE